MWFGGVEVPAELIDAAESGRLVFFVGAGASVASPAGLPLFDELVDRIAGKLGIESPGENDALDEFLGRLVDGGNHVHELVHAQIDLAGSAPNALHRALVGLAAVHGPIRIVTTNYDRHLETAARELGVAVDVFRAPALPVGHDFEGVVYLHGSLEQSGERLVVTDGDFGRAYLTDAWAARFLERMFATYSVLFVGYSHDDVVMRYVARGMRAVDGVRRFAATDAPEDRKWRQLGITPVGYPPGQHGAFADAIERWQHYSSMRLSDHRERIRDLAGTTGVPLEPDNRSYLGSSLHIPERLQFFTEVAEGVNWLRWLSKRSEFDELVSGESRVGESAQQLAPWVASQSVSLGEAGDFGLEFLATRRWSPPLWRSVVGRLASMGGPVPQEIAPWFYLILDRAIEPPEREIALLLTAADLSALPDVAIRLYERASTPAPMPRPWLLDDSIRVEAGFRCDEYSLRAAWRKAVEPLLPTHAEAVCTVVSRNIAIAYEIESRWSGSDVFDGLSFRRSAIESHSQDEHPEALDVLIDAARDGLVCWVKQDPDGGDRRIEEWASSGVDLLRRLAVHGWSVRDDVHADAKVEWLLKKGWLYDTSVHHEAFELLRSAVPLASEAARSALLDAVLAGPPEKSRRRDMDDETRRWEFSRYNMLAWLTRVAPDWEEATEAFTSLQAEHSDFAPRTHPDLGHWMTSGTVEDVRPFEVEDLHRMIADDACAAIDSLKQFRSETLNLTGPTWRGAGKALEGVVATYPSDGIEVAPLLREDDPELRARVIGGWAAAEVDHGLGEEILSVLREWSGCHLGDVGHLLAAGGRERAATRWHEWAEFRELARELWPSDAVEPRVSGGDGLIEALNSVGGDLAYFWIYVVQSEWRSEGDAWEGLPLVLHRTLDEIVTDASSNGQHARTVLLSQLHFMFGADETWTSDHLFPLLDWPSDPEEARRGWESVLHSARLNPHLLERGLLDGLVETTGHTEELSDEAEHRLARCLADIAVRAPDLPGEWLLRILQSSSKEFRAEWADQVGYSLSQAPPEVAREQWDRWIRVYWRDRLASVPIPLTGGEASAMISWVISLPEYVSETIELACQVPYEQRNFSFELHDLSEVDFSGDPQAWSQLVVHLLKGHQTWLAPTGWLQELVDKLRAADPDVDLQVIVDEALRLGLTDAANW